MRNFIGNNRGALFSSGINLAKFQCLMTMLVLCVCCQSALAGGIDRSVGLLEQTLLFHEGNYFRGGATSVSPYLKGSHAPALVNQLGPRESGEFAEDFINFFSGVKVGFKGKMNFIATANSPWNADVSFPIDTGYYSAGTDVNIDSTEFTGAVAINPWENVGVFLGPKFQSFDSSFAISGPGFAHFDGYRVDLDKDNSVGYIAGATFEKPEMGMRLGLTYASEINHEFSVRESATSPVLQPVVAATSGQKASATTPQSLTLGFRTGIAPKTALLGSIRWVDWDKYHITTPVFNAAANQALHSFREDTVTYRLGLGRRFNDELSGTLLFSYEDGHGKAANHLSPKDGFKAVALGLNYRIKEFDITGTVNYFELGDSFTELTNQSGQTFTAATSKDSTAVTVGLSVGYSF